MDISALKLGKIFINFIFPFFEKSKALELIKKDMLDVSDDLLAQLFDKVKPIFVIDDRKLIFDQLVQKPDNKSWQAAAEATVKAELEKNEAFFKEIKSYVVNVENSIPVETVNKIYNIEGQKNRIEQGQHSDGKTKNIIDGVKGDENTIIQG